MALSYAALSMMDRVWSSTVKHVKKRSVGSASREMASIINVVMIYYPRSFKDIKEILNHHCKRLRQYFYSYMHIIERYLSTKVLLKLI